MTIKKKQFIKLWLVITVVVIFWTIGPGFYRNLLANGEETYKGLKLFSDVIELIEKNHVDPVDTDRLIQEAIRGMVGSLDPHSSLLSPETLERLQIDTHGEFSGIGIVITIQDDVLTVVSPIEDTPACNAGIKAGDKIVKVDGEATKYMTIGEAVKRIKGPRGTTVVITVIREGSLEPIDFRLVRDTIPIISVRVLTLKPGYGYIRITNFNDKTTQDLALALEELKSGDVPLNGLILDLRNNPGGLLDQAVEVADMFLEEGAIVSIKGRLERHTEVFKAQPDRIRQNYPIVLLINKGSASASEIVAGALQDHRRALILGTTSFGKGSVQTVKTLRGGYGLKLTVARYYTPEGRPIEAQGIVPDIEIEYRLIEKDLKDHLDAELTPVEDRKTELRYGPIKLEQLKSDNQVVRALEILIGHEIFRGLE